MSKINWAFSVSLLNAQFFYNSLNKQLMAQSSLLAAQRFIVQPNFSPLYDLSRVDRVERVLLVPAIPVAKVRSLSASKSIYSSLPFTVAVQFRVERPNEPCNTSLLEAASYVYVPL